MELTLPGRSTPALHLRRAVILMIFSVLTWGTAIATPAAPLGIRFEGTIDLSVFGAPAISTFAGQFAWDATQTCGPGGGGEGDFALSSLDGGPPCVTASLRVDGVDHNDFQPELSRLMLFPDGMVLELWFVPAVDLDGGGSPDALLFELVLWDRDPDRVVFPDIGVLPSNRKFQRVLRDPSFRVFGDYVDPYTERARAETDTLTVIPEPPSVSLLLAGLATAGLWVRRRSKMS